jgi:hypothetical protein
MKPVGPPEVHDARVATVLWEADRCLVTVESAEGERLEFTFDGVSRLDAAQPEGMLLYALHEQAAAGPGRRFVFVNWDEAGPQRLELVARAGRWKRAGDRQWQPV